jgi:hypothetical protein
MTRFTLALAALVLGSGLAEAQNMKTLPVNRLIDNPTAGILQKGSFDFDMNLYAEGGVLISFGVGLLDRLNMGASFGGTQIISDQDPDWNGRPELALKYRLFDETVTWPALVLGYSGQGHGRWLKDVDADGDTLTSRTIDRYEIKAKGFYGVAGKNYLVGNMGLMGLHLGANINPMENDDDAGLNMWLGVDKAINDEISAVVEYDFAWDDIRTGLSKSKGFLNLGGRWTFAERLSLEVDFRDVLTNRKDVGGRPVNSVSREIRITYMESF